MAVTTAIAAVPVVIAGLGSLGALAQSKGRIKKAEITLKELGKQREADRVVSGVGAQGPLQCGGSVQWQAPIKSADPGTAQYKLGEEENFKSVEENVEIIEENKTKRIRLIAAAVVAVVALVTIVLLAHFKMDNTEIYQCVVSIVACVVAGTPHLKEVLSSETSTKKEQ